jgi:hypothetical protein
LSEENGDTPAASPAPEIQVPKYRLDEEIGKARRLEAELEATKGLIQRLVPPPQQGPAPQEDPELEELRETNPVLYRKLKEQDLRNKQLSASNFQIQEQLDRARFIDMAGKEEANRLGTIVEQRLDELRRRNIFTMSRSDLYSYLIGQEQIQARRGAKPQPKAQPQTEAEKKQVLDAHFAGDVPSSDPTASSTPAGAAPTSGKEPSLEELEAKLKGVAF